VEILSLFLVPPPPGGVCIALGFKLARIAGEDRGGKGGRGKGEEEEEKEEKNGK
jgi:hypothetical protein